MRMRLAIKSSGRTKCAADLRRYVLQGEVKDARDYSGGTEMDPKSWTVA